MDQLKAQRKIVRSNITRICNYCTNPNAQEQQILARGETIDKYFEEFEKIQDQIELEPCSTEMITENEQYREQIEEKYYAAKAIIRQHQLNHNLTSISLHQEEQSTTHQLTTVMDTLAQNQTVMRSLLERFSTSTPSTQLNCEAIIQQPSIQLPRIQLPQFDGNFNNWLHFRDLFQALIHNRQNLSEIEKFEYLKSHISGDALSLIKHLAPSNENYAVAWDLIKQKYDDSSQLRNAYLRLLLDQPAMKGPNATELKRLINNTNESINALKAMQENVDQWDSIILYNLERKVDIESQTLWRRSLIGQASVKLFMSFLEKRLQELENLQINKTAVNFQLNKCRQQPNVHAATMKLCPLCNQTHFLFTCAKFKNLSVNERIKLVKENKICFNCLQYDHVASNCSRSKCRKCHKNHNTMLHREKEDIHITNNTHDTLSNKDTVNINSVYTKNNERLTLLPTAIVLIMDADNTFHPCRILLDTGAQISLISESCVQRLKLKRKFDKTLLYGIGSENKNYTRGKVEITIKSCNNENIIKTSALCLKSLTQLQPAIQVSSNEIDYFRNLPLADPNCNKPGQIDVILGADLFSNYSMQNQIIHPSGTVSAFLTIFGWVILGSVSVQTQSHITVGHTCIDISEQLQNFWKIEEINENEPVMTEEEQKAEEYYTNTVQRDKSGRYVVRLPFKNSRPKFGNTQNQAARRLSNMETKFNKNYHLYIDYKQFMDEYLKLNHKEVITPQQAKYYLPHHAVMKNDSTTTKLRVVFDGSAKDVHGASLNDQLLVGPTIQKDIFDIITQFRKFQFALTADIEKMYRQILIHPDDREYQCILWRPSKTDQIITYQLKTITYGTSAAPFLAIRTLKQLAIDIQAENPTVAEVLLNCFYVDDFIFSTNDEETAVQIRIQLCKCLSKGGFRLRKWSTNSVQVLNTIDNEDRQLSQHTIINDNQTVKTLGLYWDTAADVFKYSVEVPESPTTTTKRTVLSMIAKIYDPLGWLSPVVINYKIFMQKLWLSGMEWDTILSDALHLEWQRIYRNINDIKLLKISRWLHYSNEQEVQLHGFADSSELAYAAVVYIKVIHPRGTISVNLVAAKTRVTPVKQVTLPRLELCACHLLTKLIIKVKNSLQLKDVETHGWTDSTIVLNWLSDHPRKWKNFIANRTSFIIQTLPAQYWHHIPSSHNPADLATRGIMPLELQKSTLWWTGPLELQEATYNRPVLRTTNSIDQEIRKKTILCVTNNDQDDIFQRFSEFSKLIRVTAMILRFIKNCKPIANQKETGFLKAIELLDAHKILVKRSQHLTFKREISILSSEKQLPENHKLSSLNPFIDDNGLLRVGGRLENAAISYDQKHPFILHKESTLTELIIRYYHIKYMHAGSRQLQYLLSLKYWIPSVVNIIKKCIYKCTTCLRHRSHPFHQQMGNLPSHRLKTTTAFENVGVDLAGPFMVRSWKGRGQKQYKSWVAVFVCLTIKAIHLEVVTELSTSAFLAALRRFVSRRGKPAHIYSDNGTNFVGCNQRLKEFVHFMLKTTTQECLARETSELGIQWHFSPPFGPNFGGIWEAGVKSLKYHLYRVMGNASLTYEELNTIICQIESCLNSRPLAAKFEGDCDPLTPAHFLILKTMQAVPDQDVQNVKINQLTRWQLLQQLVQRFWKKWSSSYLTQLQNRPKWKLKMKNLQINDVVLIRNDHAPPCKWNIGKIIELHPGTDKLVRVVTIKTTNGIYKRPISKLCPLLVE